jgi:hypothetical protein
MPNTQTTGPGLYLPASLVAAKTRAALPDGMYRATREPDPAWQVELDAITGVSDHLPRLVVVWEAGTPDEPVQRWVVWELMPKGWGHPEILHSLQHDHPDDRKALADVRQFALWRQHQRLALPFFVVQGHNGGHRLVWSSEEGALMRLLGFDAEPPRPGTLPYAEPDGRTWARIREHNVLAKAQGDLRRAKQLKADERALLEKQYRTQAVQMMCEDLDYEVARDIARGLADVDVPVASAAHERALAWEDARDEYIETGRIY